LSSFAEGTRRNLKIQWESFLLFCTYFSFCYLPASTRTLQLYAQFLSRSFKSVASIRNYLSGIRTIHQLMGYSLDDMNQFLINFTLKGIARVKGHAIKQAEPMTTEILTLIYQSMNFKNSDDHIYWCLFLFAFFLLARKSNLVPTSSKDIVKSTGLLRSDVSEIGDNLLVTLKWTKTIQLGERVLKTPLLSLPGSVLCPVEAYRNLIKSVKGKPDDFLFLLSSGRPVTYYLFQRKLRDILGSLGYDASSFSSHSFRRGFATLAFKNNVTADEIQILGDWHSDVYKRYIALDVSDKLNIVKNISHCFYS